MRRRKRRLGVRLSCEVPSCLAGAGVDLAWKSPRAGRPRASFATKSLASAMSPRPFLDQLRGGSRTNRRKPWLEGPRRGGRGDLASSCCRRFAQRAWCDPGGLDRSESSTAGVGETANWSSPHSLRRLRSVAVTLQGTRPHGSVERVQASQSGVPRLRS